MSDNVLRYSRGGRNYIYRGGIIFDVTVTDRSGAECGVCGYSLALFYPHDCDEVVAARGRFYDDFVAEEL